MKQNEQTTTATGTATAQPEWQSTDTLGQSATPSIWYS